MRRFFYSVHFEYLADGETSSFDLGVFSTRKKAEEKIENSKRLNGFADFPPDCFQIEKFGISFDEENVSKENAVLYCVFHEYYIPAEAGWQWTIFGYYASREQAEEKVRNLRIHSRIGQKYPDGFDISEIPVNIETCWSEGFDRITLPSRAPESGK